jgi:signal transduction histidine kinase
MVETIDRSGKITAKHISLSPLPRLADYVELAAYRISQELLTNIIKHSDATTITINTGANVDTLNISYAHNGQGMTQEMYEDQIYKKGATGLKNIVNRIKSINASIKFYEADEGCYITELIIPLSSTLKQS